MLRRHVAWRLLCSVSTILFQLTFGILVPLEPAVAIPAMSSIYSSQHVALGASERSDPAGDRLSMIWNILYLLILDENSLSLLIER
ncbi:hypothetical protein EDD16DRAFT_1531893 [Pisolithus croceorrhizus]|nr:hypothetical protein EDD16DRAFT_1531893 [Pisolithus croceorrhizus]